MSADPILGDALRGCVREHEGPPPELIRAVTSGGLLPLLELAKHHRVISFVHRDLRALPEIDPQTMSALERYTVMQTANQMRIVNDLAGFASAIAPLEIPWLAFKGPVAAQLFYERAELRTYRDLDLLVPRSEFPAALAYLQRDGFEILDQNWTMIRREQRGQLHLTLRMGTVADLHWHLLNRAVVREAFDVDMHGVFSRARTFQIGGVDVRTLDRTDTLVHLALHAALSGGDRLVWLKDLERAIAVEPPDWDEVALRAFSWRAGAPVASVLRRSRDLLDADVPMWVLHDLERSDVRRRFGLALDRVWPVDRADGAVTPAVLWPQVVRDGRFASIGSVARRATRRPRNAIRRLLGTEPIGGPDHEPAAVLQPSGGDDVRRDYLRDVHEGP